MKIAECSYCGMLAITDQDICSTCESMLGNETQTVEPITGGVREFQEYPRTNPNSNNEELPQSFSRSENQQQPSQTTSRSKCLRCNAPVNYGEIQCSECLGGKRKKPLSLKKIIALLIFVGAMAFFGFYYVFEKNSPWGIIRKYNRATYADNNVVFDNFSLKGDVRMTAFNFNGDPKHLDEGLSPETMANQAVGEKFLFKMIFEKPAKSGVEVFKPDNSEETLVFKQVYDGMIGWQYSNMVGQPVGYQTKQDGFGVKKFGFGLEDYDSAEFVDDVIKTEFGETNIKFLSDKKTLQINNDKKISDSKVLVKVGKKVNGVMKYSLLVFDQKTGLLLGMALKEAAGNLPLITTIFFDRYKEFSVKRQGWFGVGDQNILVPTRLTLVINPDKVNSASAPSSLVMDFNVTELNVDTQIPDNYFIRPN